MTSSNGCTFGTNLQEDGKVQFQLWAPSVNQVTLVLEDDGEEKSLPMDSSNNGWFKLATDKARVGDHYRFRMPDGLSVPDPASRYQVCDVHDSSEVVDPKAFDWKDKDWTGRPWHEAVIYELHVGTFSPEGTFDGVIKKLDELTDLGITAIELMPLSDFPGDRNWGYDGVLHFAPDRSYGTPDDLRRLVDAAHSRNIMVFIDVVYNHFGPEGNYLNVYAKEFFTEKHKTPWGAALNFEEAKMVRDFFCSNALYWLEEFHMDGLRLDAVHAIKDESALHIVQELSALVRKQFEGKRHVHIVLENEANSARFLKRGQNGKPQFATAQWNDDIHHAFHILATKETEGYYRAYSEEETGTKPIEYLGMALAEGFIYQGQASIAHEGAARGEPSAHLPPTAFISFLQNHDQVGNRAFGERLSALCKPRKLKALTAIFLLAPQIPLLFMGEEWAASSPFLYFCDLGAELNPLVTAGRRREFESFSAFADPANREQIPDPCLRTTYEKSKLNWDERQLPGHADWLSFYRKLISIRQQKIVPKLLEIREGHGSYQVFPPALLYVRWQLAGERHLALLANLADERAETTALNLIGQCEDTLFTLGLDESQNWQNSLMPAWSLVWWVQK